MSEAPKGKVILPPPTPHEQHLANLAMAAITRWHERGNGEIEALIFHPDDLTERLDSEGVTMWGVEVRHSEDVERGTVELTGGHRRQTSYRITAPPPATTEGEPE